MKMTIVFKILVCTGVHLATGAMVNIALRKPASMSSSKSGYSARTAVDGKTYDGGFGGDKTIDTAGGQRFAWWKVDLQREVQDATVRIYFRTDYKQRRNGVKLYTSTSPFPNSTATSQGQLCHTVTGDPSGSDIPDVYNATCPGRWRYLLLYTDTDNDGQGPILDFGEVEVYACLNETYGEDCTKTCSSRNCVTMTAMCERDGRCHGGCQPGYTGMDCTEPIPPCTNNYYGLNCDKLCSDRKCKAFSSSSCDRLSGRCPGGCEDGWREEDCTKECESIYYGPSCALLCNDRHCLSGQSPCDHLTGQCEGGCQAGYEDLDCTKPCSPGVTYGGNCSKRCSSRHCVTSPCASETPPSVCDPQTGQCPGECAIGWGGLDCANPCPRGTYGSNCTEKCGECDGVCDSGSGLCYEGCLDGYRGSWCNVTRTTDASSNNNIGAVVGSVLGTLLVVIMVVVGVHILLVRQGRLQWVKSSDDKKPVEMSRDITEFSNVPQSSEVSENVHAGGHVHINNYDALDPQLITGNKDYDVIQHKEYQKV